MAERPPEIDWVRLLHKGLTFFREVRGDVEVTKDTEREQLRATQARRSIETIARTAARCVAPNDCDCPLCRERDREQEKTG